MVYDATWDKEGQESRRRDWKPGNSFKAQLPVDLVVPVVDDNGKPLYSLHSVKITDFSLCFLLRG